MLETLPGPTDSQTARPPVPDHAPASHTMVAGRAVVDPQR